MVFGDNDESDGPIRGRESRLRQPLHKHAKGMKKEKGAETEKNGREAHDADSMQFHQTSAEKRNTKEK